MPWQIENFVTKTNLLDGYTIYIKSVLFQTNMNIKATGPWHMCLI